MNVPVIHAAQDSNLGFKLGTSTTCKLGLTRRLTNHFDPDLAHLVTAWPSLAPAIKAAINALVNHHGGLVEMNKV
jgi:hypothetical protein